MLQFLFYVLVFWPWGMWDLSSPARDWICTPCTGKWSLNHWSAREVPALSTYLSIYLSIYVSIIYLSIIIIICLISSNPKTHEFILSPQFPQNSTRHCGEATGRKVARRKFWPPLSLPANGQIWLWGGTKTKFSSDLAVLPFSTLTTLLRSSYKHCKYMKCRT